jgi:hypothetical protein
VSRVRSNARGPQVQLDVLGAPNRVYVIQASTNLRDWATLGLCTTDATGNVRVVDADADKYPTRLYRAVGQ